MSDTGPATRASLLLRLHDCGDAEAWEEFTTMYRPVIYRVATIKGLQHADAEDLTQGVLMSVAGAISRFDPGGPARFRTWLSRIAENATLNAISRRKADRAIGEGHFDDLLAQHPANPADSRLISIELRRQWFRMAAEQVKQEVAPDQWAAFHATAVENKSIPQVAEQLQKSIGNIYAARSRVMRRLRHAVSTIEARQS